MKKELFNLYRILLASSCLIASCAYANQPIREIKVGGNMRVETATIKNYLQFKEGEEYSQAKQQETLKRLYATSLFENINIKFESGKLIVDVKEVPLVSKVEFLGNNRIKSSILKKELSTHAGSNFSEFKIRSDVERIKQIYRKSGRYNIFAEVKTEHIENNRVKIVFNILEGPKTKIKNINFVGNNNYKDNELKSILVTKETAWFRFMDTNDTYDPERVEYDRFLLKEFYTSLGYADFRVISSTADFSPGKDYFNLTYTIEEGDKYNYGKIDLQSYIEDVDVSKFVKLINIKEGRLYNSSQIKKVVEKITDSLGDAGYSNAVIYPEEEKNYDNKTINIKFIIEKAPKVNINKINIRGNLKTHDKVIRRQFKIGEGDLFNRSVISKGEQNLRNLDYFENIEVDAVAAKSNDRADVNISLEEKSTASIQFEVGYNTMEGIVGRVNYLERNLIGTGNYLSAGVDKYRRKVSYHTGVTNPYFMDRDLTAGVSLFNRNSQGSGEVPYDLKEYGANTKLGYDIAPDLSHDVVYSIKKEDLAVRKNKRHLAQDVSNSSSHYISGSVGKFITSSVANVITYDQTDSRVVPKNGYIISGTQTFAGVGGNTKYLKHEVEGKLFKSFFNNNYTLKISGDAGEIHGTQGKKIRINERYNLGDFSFRGFAPNGIGPRDKRTGEGIGGQKFYTASAEFIFPLGLPKEFNVSGSLFTDVGSLWGFDIPKQSKFTKKDVNDSRALRASVGVGVIWVTRIAPISLYYGYPVMKKKYDEKQHWHFRFSTSF